jgi:phosphoenolpyruvate-protein phosphotransferase
MTTTLRGLPAAPGIGLGMIFVYQTTELDMEGLPPPSGRRPADPHREWTRFLEAQAAVDAELMQLSESLDSVAKDIFSIHRLILQDKTLTENVRQAIHNDQADAVIATKQVIRDMAKVFRTLDDDYFASRAADILDIGRRLLTQLGAAPPQTQLAQLPPHAILIAEDLTPSDVTQLPAQIAGIGLAFSAPTAHSSILARSLGLPLVCGVGAELMAIEAGRPAIIDGHQGRILIDPSEAELKNYSDARRRRLQRQTFAAAHAHEAAITSDGVHIPVYANANTEEDVYARRGQGADGVGLLRTEYLFQDHSAPPSVEIQTALYQRLAADMDDQPLTIRALDVGGDKFIAYASPQVEANPFLGQRGARFLLARPELLRAQFRAILRTARDLPASAVIRFMLPMISTVRELEEVQRLLIEVRMDENGRANGGSTGATIAIGVLVEVPAAALLAERLARLVDFFSIGTNDLAQYTLASDRTNSAVAALADPLHPAVLQLIERTAYAAKAFDIPISLCGEMAGDVSAVPLLLGLGVTELSAPLPTVPRVKQTIRECDMIQCRQIAESALRCDDADDVRALLAIGVA